MRNPIQIVFVTRDIRAAMDTLSRDLGAGPWFWRERGVFPNQRLRGEPVETALSIAMAYAGDMLYELIQQLDDGPSVYRDPALPDDRMHHFGIATEDFAAECARYRRQGYDLVYEAEVANGARVAYFDTRGALPVMIEVIEMLPAARAMFAGFRAAHDGWDGTDPIRPMRPVGG